MNTIQGCDHMGRRLVLLLLFSASLAGTDPVRADETQLSESAIREAYERRQRALARVERREALKLVRRQADRQGARELPLTVKSLLAGFSLIVLGAVADRRRWLPALLGNDLCRRLGYAFLSQGQKHWPRLRSLPRVRIRAPQRIPLLQNPFLNPDDDDDDDRLVNNLEAVEKYTEEDLGFDPRVGGRLRPGELPLPDRFDSFEKAA